MQSLKDSDTIAAGWGEGVGEEKKKKARARE